MTDRFFNLRLLVTCLALMLAALGLYAVLPLSMAASGFDRTLPRNHPFAATFHAYEGRFLGTNRIDIMVEAKQGTVWNREFFTTFKAVVDDAYGLPGVAQPTVRSLWSELPRPLPASQDSKKQRKDVAEASDPLSSNGLSAIRENAVLGGHIGRLVSTDSRAVLISAEVLDRDPLSGTKLDYLELSAALEQLRARYENGSIGIAIIGYAKERGEIAAQTSAILLFLGLASVIAALGVFIYARSFVAGAASVFSLAIAPLGQFVFMNVEMGGVEPLSLLLLLFTLSLSVAATIVQLGAFRSLRMEGLSPAEAARRLSAQNVKPLAIILLALSASCAVLYVTPIPAARLNALAILVGCGLTGASSLIVLPLVLGFGAGRKLIAASYSPSPFLRAFPLSIVLLVLVGCVLALGQSQHRGGLSFATMERKETSSIFDGHVRYHRDENAMTRTFPASLNDFVVIAETSRNGCLDYAKLEFLNLFSRAMENTQGVARVRSLPFVLKRAAARLNDGNLKWQDIPRGRDSLARAITTTETRGLMLGPACSALPVHIFLDNAAPATIQATVKAARRFAATHGIRDVELRLASGNMGIAGAVQEKLKSTFPAMMIWSGIVLGVVLLVVYRSMSALLRCAVPFLALCLCATAFPHFWHIPVTVDSMPMPFLILVTGMGFLLVMQRGIDVHLREGRNITESVQSALTEYGGGILAIGLTMMIAAASWSFSPFKLQADLGVACAVMFAANIFAALVLLPLWSLMLDILQPRGISLWGRSRRI